MTEKITMSSAGLQWLETAWRERGGSGTTLLGTTRVSPLKLSLHQTPDSTLPNINRSDHALLTIINIIETDGIICQ